MMTMMMMMMFSFSADSKFSMRYLSVVFDVSLQAALLISVLLQRNLE
jgi:hypothetical protein